MTGVRMETELRGFDQVDRGLEHFRRFDWQGLGHAIGAELESQTRRRITEEKASPDGVPWPDWSEDYAATRHGGHSLLQGDDDLLDSVQSLVSDDQVETGSNLIYAAIHNYGGEEVGMPIPQREYLGLSDENTDDLQATVDDFVDRFVEDV